MTLFYLLILLLSFSLTWLYRKYALHKSLMDIPNDRSSHTVPTPRGGGVAVVLAWFGGLLWLFVQQQIDENLFLAFLAGLPLVIISYLDDIYTLKPGLRFLVQAFSAAGALWFLQGLHVVDFGFATISSVWLWTPVAFIAILWAINLFNFLDGIDGYISSEVACIGLTLFAIFMDATALLLAIAIIGFLIWNWPKAKIFMGDVGSTLLGFNVAVFAIWYQNTQDVSVLFFLIITGAFWYDATITLYRRWRNKEKLSEAHRKHAYQRLTQSGLSHQQVTIGLWGVNLALLGLAYVGILFSGFIWAAFILALLLLAAVMYYADRRKEFS